MSRLRLDRQTRGFAVDRPERFRGGFRKRLTGWLIGLTAVMSLASGMAHYQQQRSFVRANQTSRGRTIVSHLAGQSELGAYSGDRGFLATAVREAYDEPDVSFVAVYDQRGRVLESRIKPDSRLSPYMPESVLIELRRRRELGSPVIRQGEEHLDFFAPVIGVAEEPEQALLGASDRANTLMLGVAHVGLSRRPAQEQLDRVRAAGLLISLVTLGLGVLVALLIARRISKPILALAEGADKVRAGELGLQIALKRPDELGVLADSFNRMSATLSNTVGSLAHLNQNLEEEVAKRTRELEERNVTLLQQRNKLEEVSRLKSEFLANMTHELRTPLNAVIGYAELMADGIYGDVNSEQESSLRAIAESGGHLLTLINDILDLSKAESGRMHVDWTKVDLCQLIRDVVEETRPLARDRPYRVTLELPPKLEFVSDGTKVRQILVNLLGNALKFTERGSVTIGAHHSDDGLARLFVRDTGIGIAEEHQELIFDAFRQVDGSSTRKHGGTGLGLAISQKLARLLGGRIELQSEPGRGSTFTLVLPPPSPVDMPSQQRAGVTFSLKPAPAPAAPESGGVN